MPHNVREKATATGDLVEPTTGGWDGREWERRGCEGIREEWERSGGGEGVRE